MCDNKAEARTSAAQAALTALADDIEAKKGTSNRGSSKRKVESSNEGAEDATNATEKKVEKKAKIVKIEKPAQKELGWGKPTKKQEEEVVEEAEEAKVDDAESDDEAGLW